MKGISMKLFYILFVVVSILVILLIGCNKSSSSTGTEPVITIDKDLIGVWYNPEQRTGVEIKGDGSAYDVYVNSQGKLASSDTTIQQDSVRLSLFNVRIAVKAPADNKSPFVITTENNKMTVTVKKSPFTGNDTLYIMVYGYLFTNTCNSAFLTVPMELPYIGYLGNIVYERTFVGTVASTITPYPALSLTLGGTTDKFSVFIVGYQNSMINVQAQNQNGAAISFNFSKIQGTQQIGGYVYAGFSRGGYQYSATSGSFSTTFIVGNHIICTMNLTMKNNTTQAITSATGKFEVVHQ